MTNTNLSQMFVKRFGIGIDLAMPNTDAMYIKTLLEDGAYEEACEKLIDYYGENSVVALNDKIRSLKDEINRINDDRKDLRESNEAEHREKVCYMDRAEEAAKLLEEVDNIITKSEYSPGLLVRIHEFLDRFRRDGL